MGPNSNYHSKPREQKDVRYTSPPATFNSTGEIPHSTITTDAVPTSSCTFAPGYAYGPSSSFFTTGEGSGRDTCLQAFSASYPANAYIPPSHTNNNTNLTFSPSSATPTDTLAENEALLKRLRNTAASARFRARKKQREKNLEEQEREKREELEALEKRIRDLEEENRFLKELVFAPRGN